MHYPTVGCPEGPLSVGMSQVLGSSVVSTE